MKTFESIFKLWCGVYTGFPHRFGKKPKDIVRPRICHDFVRDFMGIDYGDETPQKIKITMSTKKFDGAQRIYLDLFHMNWGTGKHRTFGCFYDSTEKVLGYKLLKYINNHPDNIIPIWVGITQLNTEV